MTAEQLTSLIIGSAITVHRALGPGLLENVYKECLYHKLRQAGIVVDKEKAIPVVFEGISLECGYRLDLLVDNRILVEIKSIKEFSDLHLAQTLTYMKLGQFEHGLLLNFNVKLLKDGVKKLINTR